MRQYCVAELEVRNLFQRNPPSLGFEPTLTAPLQLVHGVIWEFGSEA